MFEDIKEKIFRREKLLFGIFPFIAILIIFVNSNTLKSFFVGFAALIIYLFVNGEILGRAFFSDEGTFFKFVFGLFTFLVLLALMGMLAVFIFHIEIWYILGMILAGVAASLINQVLVRYDKSQTKISGAKKPLFKGSFIKAVYISYILSFVLSFSILFNQRSGWVVAQPSIWAVIPVPFLDLYFIATVILAGIIFLPGERTVKVLLIALHSTFSLLFVPTILYPGIFWPEAWGDLGRARTLPFLIGQIYESYPLGVVAFVRTLNSILKGVSVQVLVVTFAGALNIDMYWSDVLLVPILWGVFVPLTSYKLTEMIGGSQRASILAAFLTIPNFYFLAWGKLSISNSMGNLLFFLWLYLLLRFLSSYKTRMLFPMLITLGVITASHFLPTIMAISFAVLAFALKKYQHLSSKTSNEAYFLLFSSFVFSVLVLPMGVFGRGIVLPMLGESPFSVNKLLGTSILTLVLGVSEDTQVRQALLHNMIFPLLCLAGFAYASHKKAKFNKTLCLFLFLGFGVTVIDHRILANAMEGGLFGAPRVNVFRDISALPFVAVVTAFLAKFVSGTVRKTRSSFKLKNIAGGALVCITLSSWVTLMIYDNYEYYTWGLMPTSLEVEAITYIDEQTQGRYVVLGPGSTINVAYGFLGVINPQKWLFNINMAYKSPSVSQMYQYMETADADVGYLIVPSFRVADLDKIVAQASQMFGLFKVIGDEKGEIYIFRYNLPPLPTSSDVVAFYWDTPPAYFIQNDVLRVMINTATNSLDVRDFWGDLYESIPLNKILVGGAPLGNLTSVQYLDIVENEWVEWEHNLSFPSAEQFQFKIIFEQQSLVGLVKKGEGSVELRWQSGQSFNLSLDAGVFRRLYIPGLLDGKDSYDINSREYGFLYTRSLTDNVVLLPAYEPDLNSSSLTYSQIVEYCSFNLTTGYMSYDLYVHNIASVDQWSYVEIWLPDEVYTGSSAPLYYSIDDGKTWAFAPYNVEIEQSVPIVTSKGAEVNWIHTIPKTSAMSALETETPTEWASYTKALGGSPELPESYTVSGGAQNRILFGFYLPAEDQILVRLGTSVYYRRPLNVSYVFKDSYDVSYGLRNMEEGLLKFYTIGSSEYVGGLTLTSQPESLIVAQDEEGVILSIAAMIPANTTFSLLSGKGIDTTIDADGDGVPDLI